VLFILARADGSVQLEEKEFQFITYFFSYETSFVDNALNVNWYATDLYHYKKQLVVYARS